MIQEEYFVIGVMSGTSLDGIDIAYLQFEKKSIWNSKIVLAETISYAKAWEKELRNAITYNTDELDDLNTRYTHYLASVINQFIDNKKIKKIDAICSHGHTILHQPDKGLTLQIGNLPEIAELIKQKVVCDFRVQDVQLGGQGAPLVPIGDELLFSKYDYCLNLGGFSNVSALIEGDRIAYDISPVNIVMNQYVSELGLAYDDRGQLARKGGVNEELLDKLNSLEFYQLQAPKSLGLEWVMKEVFPLINSFKLSVQDILRTFVEHIAIQIGGQFKNGKKVLITGGGVYNDFLIERIQFYTEARLIKPTNALIEFKEALIFGFLGVLKLRNEVNVLASVTGARKDHSSGRIINYYNSN